LSAKGSPGSERGGEGGVVLIKTDTFVGDLANQIITQGGDGPIKGLDGSIIVRASKFIHKYLAVIKR